MRRFNAIGWIALALVLAMVAVGVTFAVRAASGDPATTPTAVATPTTEPKPIVEARNACDDYTGTNIKEAPGTPGDGGHSLTMSTDFGEDSIEAVACVLYYLDVPDYVIARMDSTRALDGMQEAQWDGFQASWTYHPDDGLNIVVSESTP